MAYKSIVRAIINFADNLDFKVTAEGVEASTQVNLLTGMVCDYIQGYVYSKSLDKENAISYIRSQNVTATK